ncbi:MAG: flavoprotein [Kiritimatiellae bacterium]|nr:flavoprotein [Kiritimatiellia bacterium]MDD3543941.1 flavoprotein [Kiritimatiellia bacterium]MDD4025184.1 flavoprotein [Kiritimatiellia bacterium]MDD4622476.1 flavoprotein [Kiritimatiellia bacterium]
MANIVLGVTGSIAAYKACELTRLFVQADHQVHVAMTAAAARFVAPLTFRTLSQNPAYVDMFDEPAEWMPEHISLAAKADLMVIAPCTANVIAKIAHGLADDLLTATALACKAPLLVVPAMNTAMWENPATRANVATLESRQIKFVDAGTGDLACGTSGKGRMAEPGVIFKAALSLLSS